MFVCLSFLEDSGYMARATFVMDRFMRLVGLPGKAFVPMLVGFGCNVPAIMATRTLENHRDRILTILMNPFMSCGGRLPVYALFAAAFFQWEGRSLVFGLYLLGIGFAVITGLVLKNTLLKGEITPFVMELPPYHLPTVRGVLMRAWDRLKAFMFRAGKVMIPVIIILSFLHSMGTDGSFGNEDSGKSVLSAIGKSITPVLSHGDHPGKLAGNRRHLHRNFRQRGGGGDPGCLLRPDRCSRCRKKAGPKASTSGAVSVNLLPTIPENLRGAAGTLLDPLRFCEDVSSVTVAAEEQAVAVGTFGAMVALFDGKVGAFAYLLLVLLYIPCAAAISTIYRETSLGWTAFACSWNAPGWHGMAAYLLSDRHHRPPSCIIPCVDRGYLRSLLRGAS
ncbi:MAG: nucleoside recognition domain-containing protein [Desulfotignum sp.]|nr:nucleoside recognition domain-containing protein [Desulfotignum sp.]